ncbi:protein-L-isoaspartate(D-aspartate) O-methyltransferase [Paraburkholderia sp. CNPSo 3272]|uniref:protein-L-isoaspartate(D-aspartate) O-methyltransferase n=2 Tax=unclassified Paraburkholderia TaxID=2615204 RepID=UPI0020B81DB4|nr:protein-L-isoaspartate(D-aspartate) O-methyltransferase [Paraburkholderia sp. CNPSo 3272]MCP3721633.1 protein-L-isoaspartate(D-aspartate) O-methyltransferase [Paraburkholderia sp. CNPSo 3272]
MTGERTKRFPLGLADLVREPRRRDARPGDARTSLASAGNSGPSKAGVGALAKPAAKAGSPAVAKSVASTPFKAPPAKPVNAKPVNAKPVSPKPVSAKPANSVKPAHPAGNAAAPRAAVPGGASVPRAAMAVTGAPAVALNGAHALTSERVRERMVERLRANGIADARVLQALAAVPRHMFIDPGLATQAYEDAALPIGHHQTISKPSVVARMLELAGAGRVLERVLEIGTGCGYQAAVLSQIARDVYSIERIKPLYERAKTNLRPLRIPNIRLHYGDGRLGLPSAAPFDAIVIAAAGFDVPQALLEQLAIGGRLVAPVAVSGTQSAAGEATQVLTLVERTGPAQWRESRLDRVFFVPLKSGVI